jgi:hypothetical protein
MDEKQTTCKAMNTARRFTEKYVGIYHLSAANKSDLVLRILKFFKGSTQKPLNIYDSGTCRSLIAAKKLIKRRRIDFHS